MGIEDIPPSAHTPQMEKTKDKGLALPTVLEEQTRNNNRTPESVEHRLPFVGGSSPTLRSRKEPDTLFGLRKEQEETLCNYARRYWEEYNDLEENVCSEQMAIMSFKHGLRPESKLRQSLTKCPAITLKDLRARIEQYARLEDDQILIEVASVEQTARHKKRTDRGEHWGLMANEVDKSKSHKAVVIVFKEPIYRILEKIKREPFFIWPPKMLGDPVRRNQKLRCTYHQDKGHMTQNYRALKQHLEDLVAAGHLRDYIDQDKAVAESGNPPQEPNNEHPPRLVINVIHGTTTQKCEEALEEEIAKAVQIQQVMSVKPASKKVHIVPKSPLCTISFTRKDLEGIQHPHTDALIITMGIGKRFDIKRVLIDQGSAADILYYDLFRKLSLSKQHLTTTVTPLVGFNSQPEWPLGRIVLPVVAGTKTLQIEFFVINTPSPYNAILGHPWIHQMEAVPSTYHQLIHFPTEHGVE
ncbi:uncharacterized protein LOC114282575 [Camellia sinensis]|uniref:uncharacterized protein LOC114282575 n=1 Tax=Camellia sinensis TaxID=4442 RepID=UPI0010358125|nr:uncharacterized protein LOC114282575 [Camellia sinensis]